MVKLGVTGHIPVSVPGPRSPGGPAPAARREHAERQDTGQEPERARRPQPGQHGHPGGVVPDDHHRPGRGPAEMTAGGPPGTMPTRGADGGRGEWRWERGAGAPAAFTAATETTPGKDAG